MKLLTRLRNLFTHFVMSKRPHKPWSAAAESLAWIAQHVPKYSMSAEEVEQWMGKPSECETRLQR